MKNKLFLPDNVNKDEVMTKVETDYITSIIKKNRHKFALEIGLGMGISGFHIGQIVEGHTIIDPLNDFKGWFEIGLKNVPKQNIRKGYSSLILPEIFQTQITYDFIFIDGSHYFEECFIDLFWCRHLVNKGGHILLHDAVYPAVQKVISHAKNNYPDLTFVEIFNNIATFKKNYNPDERDWNDFTNF